MPQGGDEPNPAQLFGRRFKAARVAAGLTQVDVAKALGVAQPRVAEWEAGRVVPPILRLYEVIDILGLDDADILVRPKGERIAQSERESES